MELAQGHSASKSQDLSTGRWLKAHYTTLSLRELGRVQEKREHRAREPENACFL